MANDITFKTEKSFGDTIKTAPSGWETKLTLTAWNEGETKFDIRSWSPDGDKAGKGVSLTREELITLRNNIDIALAATK